ncbi:MAG: glycosyltransferase [Rhodocyclales bacterium]|nr:glycosyltransferase [Rhodocyclales bacterium]
MSHLQLHFSADAPDQAGVTHVPLPPAEQLGAFVSQLQWPDRSAHSIVVDGLIEKLPQADSARFLHECRRIMAPGATLRIVTPDLDTAIDDYVHDRKSPAWEAAGIYWTDNRCERLNLLLGKSGAKWLYNERELNRLADLVGLCPLAKRPIDTGQGPTARFPSLPCSIFEFVKPDRCLAPDARPLVTIAIPSYKPEFFAAALQSALDQTYPNLDIVICDDCPDDGIRLIAQNFVARDERIRYLRNPQRLARQNLARCLEVARGEFFKLLCDDDVLAATSIERMLDCFRTCDDVTLVTSKRQRIDENGAALPDVFDTLAPLPQDGVIEGLSLGAAMLSSARNFIGEPTTALFRKAEVAHIRPDYCSVDGQLIDGMNDVAVWINLATRGDTVYLTDALSQFRCHPNQNQLLYREMLLASSLHGLKVMRMSFDRLGFSKGQFFGTIKWKPLHAPRTDWLLRTIQPNYAGWTAVDQPAACGQAQSGGDPDQAHYREAADLLARGETETAIARLITLAENGSRHWAVYNDLGAYAWKTGDRAGATDLFRHAWSLDPSIQILGLNYANALMATEQWSELDTVLTEHLDRYPDDEAAGQLRHQLNAIHR